MNFDFLLNNIGPINKAEISLDDLTVLVGSNSIGKSLISKSAYLAIKGLLLDDKKLIELIEEEVYKPELYKKAENISLSFKIDGKSVLDLKFDPLEVSAAIPDVKITDITYVEGPLVINEEIPEIIGVNHNDDLKNKLINKKIGFNPERDIKIKEINSLIDEVVEKHKLIYKEEKRRFYLLISEDFQVPVNKAPNGLKSFIILKELLNNGYLTRNSVLLLDEPEILSHPSWQLVYAHILAKIIKYFGVKVIVNTCSMYFIEALEMYTSGYNLGAEFYLGTKDDGGYRFLAEEGSLHKIYMALLDPYEKLDDLRMGYIKEE